MGLRSLFTPAFPLKLIEIAICLTCLGMIRHYNLGFGGTVHTTLDRRLVGVIAFGGMILVTAPMLIGLIAGEVAIEKSYQEVIYNVVGFIVMIVAGIMALEAHNLLRFLGFETRTGKEAREAGLAMGALGIVNSIVYLIDAFVAYRVKRT
ncbi:protein snakeskin-like [Pollicipes pollicipes]|uniref:protein snakeskin-like n=1 Tax=Pollicipes pollicipes TaxID=41117 RepID=UPI00188508E3|nr:protein snakeskin-like [Pollicipes pollicipes]